MRYLALLFLLPSLVFAETYEGKVIHISDGDTVKILVDNHQHKIRLAEIDTPEKRQAYGKKAKKALGDIVLGKVVRVDWDIRDRYKRIIGKIYLGDLYVNAEMVRQGHAWVYRKHSKDPELIRLETEAKAARRGLWASDVRVPPWERRRKKRN